MAAVLGALAWPPVPRGDQRDRSRLVIPEIGELHVSCPDRGAYVMALTVYPNGPDAQVAVRIPGRPARRRQVLPGATFRVEVPVHRRRSPPATGLTETPEVRWRLRQISQPHTVRGSLALRVTSDIVGHRVCHFWDVEMTVSSRPHSQ